MENRDFFDIKKAEIDKIFHPFVIGNVSYKNVAVLFPVEELVSQIKIAFGTYNNKTINQSGQVSIQQRKDAYEKYWDKMKFSNLRVSKNSFKKTCCIYNSNYVVANPVGIKRAHLYCLVKIIKNFQPRSVLEMGSGQGLNLSILANIFPDIKFTGIELTEIGINGSNNLKNMDKLPEEIVAFSPQPFVDGQAHKSVSYIIGSAHKTDFENRSFDLVFTRQALEQMNSIKLLVLEEIRRVSRKH